MKAINRADHETLFDGWRRDFSVPSSVPKLPNQVTARRYTHDIAMVECKDTHLVCKGLRDCDEALKHEWRPKSPIPLGQEPPL